MREPYVLTVLALVAVAVALCIDAAPLVLCPIVITLAVVIGFCGLRDDAPAAALTTPLVTKNKYGLEQLIPNVRAWTKYRQEEVEVGHILLGLTGDLVEDFHTEGWIRYEVCDILPEGPMVVAEIRGKPRIGTIPWACVATNATLEYRNELSYLRQCGYPPDLLARFASDGLADLQRNYYRSPKTEEHVRDIQDVARQRSAGKRRV